MTQNQENLIDAKGCGEAGSVDQGRFYFFGIGIDTYLHTTPLESAVRDAKAFRDVLVNTYGFENPEEWAFLANEKATRLSILKGLDAYIKKLRVQDSLVIFFAGHGAKIEGSIKERGWLPYDVPEQENNNFIKTLDICDKLAKMKANHILLIQDACWVGNPSRDASSTREEPTSATIAKESFKKKSLQVLASGGYVRVADGGLNGHTDFVQFLLDELRKTGAHARTVDDVYHNVVKLIEAKTKTKTLFERIFAAGCVDDGGNFVFFKDGRVPDDYWVDSGASDRKTSPKPSGDGDKETSKEKPDNIKEESDRKGRKGREGKDLSGWVKAGVIATVFSGIMAPIQPWISISDVKSFFGFGGEGSTVPSPVQEAALALPVLPARPVSGNSAGPLLNSAPEVETGSVSITGLEDESDVLDLAPNSALVPLQVLRSPMMLPVRDVPDTRPYSQANPMPLQKVEAVQLVPRGTFLLDTPQAYIEDLEFSPDSEWLAVATNRGRIRLISPETGELIRALEIGELVHIRDMEFSHDSRLLAAADAKGSITVWSVETGAQVAQLTTAQKRPEYISFRRDNKTVVFGDSGALWLWDVLADTAVQIPHLPPLAGPILATPQEDVLYFASGFGGIWSVDLKTNVATEIIAHTGIAIPIRMSLSANGKWLSLQGQTLQHGQQDAFEVWRMDTGSRVFAEYSTERLFQNVNAFDSKSGLIIAQNRNQEKLDFLNTVDWVRLPIEMPEDQDPNLRIRAAVLSSDGRFSAIAFTKNGVIYNVE